MNAVFSLLTVVTLSLLVTRLAVAALMLTGVSHQLARLQILSAYLGVGFTTSESEHLVNHPVRRRILTLMMIVGNVGAVSGASTLILSFVGVTTRAEGLWRAGWLLTGLAALVLVARSKWVERRMLQAMRWALSRWTDLEAYDFVELLELAGGYRVRTILVEPGDWIEGRRLEELKLFEEGVTVLGIHRADGRYLGVPRGETAIRAGDRLVLYGLDERLRDLDARRSGEHGSQAHRQAMADHEQRCLEQSRSDEALLRVETGGQSPR
ncbi:TrkA C-terminal domain-containing protein [Paludisphaera soli]|uniref:TrkA C-terminal domain-containing protein n=1 Tax=Paludisphaera soli TaxID=2712865 RepID=UPI0013EC906B|nr:TrkA C-terminal domain-containing protein [Paludisphaera soli]